jgi:hypothetical protein
MIQPGQNLLGDEFRIVVLCVWKSKVDLSFARLDADRSRPYLLPWNFVADPYRDWRISAAHSLRGDLDVPSIDGGRDQQQPKQRIRWREDTPHHAALIEA